MLCFTLPLAVLISFVSADDDYDGIWSTSHASTSPTKKVQHSTTMTIEEWIKAKPPANNAGAAASLLEFHNAEVAHLRARLKALIESSDN